MSVIVELTVPSTAFELGRILRVEGPTQITLETMVPLGGKPTPFVRIRNDARETFERSVSDHPSVNEIQLVDTHDDETLYALDWEPSDASLLRRILDLDAVLLGATGTTDSWGLELRFPTHEALSAFQDHYVEEDIGVTVERIYNPTKPDAGPWYGLTPPQRETLADAVSAGYYSLPRQISTQELADSFDISDQAVTERLRRGISTLVRNTLLVEEPEE
ncbi:helix-turn-helix domain-containing protein [Halorubrum sp. E3]|jgi:predicted DNA binding protein|nr:MULTISPECIES: helix-turn-helix domain-containing protein [Halorubrum distributum group]MYL16983.1 helix-turn-helix domain-containing protein [Halorubrum terrestre]OYR82297.1 helix-turn-helix domain-containing protein [Halorubrum distributum]OYR84220.1 helix-turn-helix domain-containing protein [Halorubrum sp. E3]